MGNDANARMKAVAALACGVTGVVEIPMPAPRDYQCLTKIDYCGICNGTDLKLINNKVMGEQIRYPTILGHEGAGHIVAVGPKVRHWKVGDRVVSPVGRVPRDSGFACNYGQMAEYGITHDIQAMIEDGADLGRLPDPADYQCKPIPDGMKLRDAVMLLTFKENYSALTNFGLQPGMDVLLCGDGPVAMGIACMAKARGARRVICMGHHDDRLDHIRECVPIDGAINSLKQDPLAALGGQRLDMIVDAVGSLDTVKQMAPALRPGGVIGLYGVLSRERANLNLFDLPNHVSLHILNWPYGEQRAHDDVVALVQSGKLVPSQYYSHVIPMEEANRGFELVASRKAIKVILQMPGTPEE